MTSPETYPVPNLVVFVRHGQSEANVIQQRDKLFVKYMEAGDEDAAAALPEIPEALRERPDWEHRLTDKGIAQAQAAGAWLLENMGDVSTVFQGRYHSLFVRARETASYLSSPDCLWRPHNMIHERDWGQYGMTPRSEQEARFPHTYRMKKASPLYARLDGGEAIGDNVALRVRSFRETTKRKFAGKNVIAVTHGDVFTTARFVYERMLPEEVAEMESDPTQRIGNCALMAYASFNPNDPTEKLPYFGWRLMIQPDDLASSPFNGEWQQLPDKRFMSGSELQASVEQFPRLIPGLSL